MQLKDNVNVRQIVDQAGERYRQEFQTQGWWHSIELGDGRITPGVRKLDELYDHYNSFDLPTTLTGKRVLDIGCWDGFYSFQAESHGAEVVAIDCWRPETFFEARSALNSRVEFHEMSVYEITREKLGSFDIVLFLGVLYHLQHPLLALQRVCEVTREFAIIESQVIDHILNTGHPVMEFYEMDELAGQYDNWWRPNTDCMLKMARTAGFVRNDVLRTEGTYSVIKASRHFAGLKSGSPPAIQILDVINACTFDRRLPRRGRHAYWQIWADGMPKAATRENVQVIVESYGALPIHVGEAGMVDGETCRMQINFPAPPGLDTGHATVQVFCEGETSNQFTIEICEGSEW